MENDHINFWYRQSGFLLTSRALSLTNECSCHFVQHHPQLLPPFLVRVFQIYDPLPTPNSQTFKQARLIKGRKLKPNHHILCAINIEVHLQNVSEALTRSQYSRTIYFVITMESYHIFYGLILLIQGLFYSLLVLFN